MIEKNFRLTAVVTTSVCKKADHKRFKKRRYYHEQTYHYQGCISGNMGYSGYCCTYKRTDDIRTDIIGDGCCFRIQCFLYVKKKVRRYHG